MAGCAASIYSFRAVWQPEPAAARSRRTSVGGDLPRGRGAKKMCGIGFDVSRNRRRLAGVMIQKPQLKSPSLTGAHAYCMISWRRMEIEVRWNGRGWQ